MSIEYIAIMAASFRLLFALGQVLLFQMFRLAPLLLTWLAVSGLAKGVEPTADKSDLPRVSPTSPKNVINTFSIRDGFEIQLVAAEPLVVDPVAMAFDEHGRLYVVEMIGYSEHRDDRLAGFDCSRMKTGTGSLIDQPFLRTTSHGQLRWRVLTVACLSGRRRTSFT